MNLSDMIDSAAAFFRALPPIAGAAFTFAVGWIIARFARFLLPKLLSALRFDRFSDKTGLTGILRKGNVEYAPSRLTGILAYWVIMVIVLSNTVARLDEGAANSISVWISSALPNLIVTTIIVVIGVVVVTFLSNFFITIARNAAMRNPVPLGKAIKYAGFAIVATMAMDQLGLGQTIVSTIFILLFGAVALGLALAFGLGCKDMARRFLEDFVRNLKEKERIGRGGDLEG
ncbi:MAG TPA: hypothetical protein VIO60_00640 [Rectinemataceae bacterium]